MKNLQMKKVILICALFLIASCQQKSTLDPNINPFFQEWTTSFEVPPFLDIRDEHYMPAFEKGMAENLEEIDAIVNNANEPTFANTIEALERTGTLLTKVQRVFSNLASSNTNPQLQELQRELSPLLSAHYDKITLNQDLFSRIDKVWKSKDDAGLTNEQEKNLKQINKNINEFRVHVLQGVTGSGKTLVYFETIRKVIEKKNKQ